MTITYFVEQDALKNSTFETNVYVPNGNLLVNSQIVGRAPIDVVSVINALSSLEAADVASLRSALAAQVILEAADVATLKASVSAQVTLEAADVATLKASVAALTTLEGADVAALKTALAAQVSLEAADVAGLKTSFSSLSSLQAADVVTLNARIGTQVTLHANDVATLNASMAAAVALEAADITALKLSVSNLTALEFADNTRLTSAVAALTTLEANDVAGLRTSVTALQTSVTNLAGATGVLNTLATLKEEMESVDPSPANVILTSLTQVNAQLLNDEYVLYNTVDKVSVLQSQLKNSVLTLQAKDNTSDNYQLSIYANADGTDCLVISKGSTILMQLSNSTKAEPMPIMGVANLINPFTYPSSYLTEYNAALADIKARLAALEEATS